MKHRLFLTFGLAVIACAAVAATAAAGGKGRLFQFRGQLLSTSTTAVQLEVQGGNRPALRAMLGQSQDQNFSYSSTTEFLIWRNGVPSVGNVGDLKTGDWVTVNVRAKGGSSLSDIEANPAGTVGDHLTRPGKMQPLYLYSGTVDGPQAGGHILLHVHGGNRLALRTLIGQSGDQTFTYDVNTIFLMWQGKVPTVIDPSQLKAGDRITVRIRAPRKSTLAQIEATPARHVGDHEPANDPDNGA
ncbi:MAG TPA: hypothetical protein VFA97_02430 [Gaiellaceae bacterium]|nr:hypothetical protein [Gaiellaceae bacterium]